jgi:hypothetical protein
MSATQWRWPRDTREVFQKAAQVDFIGGALCERGIFRATRGISAIVGTSWGVLARACELASKCVDYAFDGVFWAFRRRFKIAFGTLVPFTGWRSNSRLKGSPRCINTARVPLISIFSDSSAS